VCQEEDELLVINGENMRIRFDKKNGAMIDFSWHGIPIIIQGPSLNIWRAPTDNDGFKFYPNDETKLLGQWLKYGFDRLENTPTAFAWDQKETGIVQVRTAHKVGAEGIVDGFDHRVAYQIRGDGKVITDHEVICGRGLPFLPRIGVQMVLPGGFEEFSWFGRGPEENYIDRNTGTLIGLYTGTVDGQYVPYIMPQENGNKTDVRWAALRNEAGMGLIAIGNSLMEVSVAHFTAHDLFYAFHTHELVRRDEIYLNLDLRQSGLGGHSCGPMVLPQYLVEPKNYEFSVLFCPLDPGSQPLEQLGRIDLQFI
jgi:hypothetical protein